MKVKQMWSNMLGMIHWEKTEEGAYIEPVAVIPWEEWEKYEQAIEIIRQNFALNPFSFIKALGQDKAQELSKLLGMEEQ